jgi:3-hydroxyacyl-[acyl-carrier-protein] dehydratase
MKQAIESAGLTAVTTDADGNLCRSFRFAVEFPGFSGHFPGYPVLPAVVQVLCAQVVIEGGMAESLRLRRLERAKFFRQVRPEQTLLVCCRRLRPGEESLWEVRLELEGEPAAAFRMVLAEEEKE